MNWGRGKEMEGFMDLFPPWSTNFFPPTFRGIRERRNGFNGGAHQKAIFFYFSSYKPNTLEDNFFPFPSFYFFSLFSPNQRRDDYNTHTYYFIIFQYMRYI